jgi:alpha-L-fucosidase
MPTAEHHDNFALWDSAVTPFNAKKMGPKRDLIGDLAAAVRRQGLKFGVSNHGMENFTFVNPNPDLDARLKAANADLYDPQWADFYHVADRSPEAMQKFLTDWVNRNLELIDKYQPDLLWFDNGVNLRVLDPLKLHVAAYYYNRAKTWGKDVSLSTKYVAYAPSNDDAKQIGAILDFEKVGARSPAGLRPGPWQVDDAIGSTWGYSTGMKISDAHTILRKLIDTVSKGGNYLLNISPMADGTIPQPEQDTLLGIGQWLDTNGDAIYGTRPWTTFGNGNLRFTTKGDTLYVITLDKPEGDIVIPELAADKVQGKVDKVELLGQTDPVDFSQGGDGLHIKPPPSVTGSCAFKITGLILQPVSGQASTNQAP